MSSGKFIMVGFPVEPILVGNPKLVDVNELENEVGSPEDKLVGKPLIDEVGKPEFWKFMEFGSPE